MLQRGTNIMANQVKTPMQNYFEKVLYENLRFLPCVFFQSSRGIKKNLNKPLWLLVIISAAKKQPKNPEEKQSKTEDRG